MAAFIATQNPGDMVATEFYGGGANLTGLTRSEISPGAPLQVLINDALGSITSEAQLATVRGGTGIDSSLSTGVAKIASGVWSAGTITNSDVDAAAAIARSKLASAAADSVVVNGPTGVMTTELQLAPVRGGTGIDSSLSTGVAKVSTGVWSASAIVNADIDPAAAIARSKIAAGTSGQVVINGVGGALSSEAQLNVARGGTGQDFSGVGAGPFAAQIASGVFSAVQATPTAVAGSYVTRDGSGATAVGGLISPSVTATAGLALTSGVAGPITLTAGNGIINTGNAAILSVPSGIAGGRVLRYAVNSSVAGAAFVVFWSQTTVPGTSYAVFARLAGIDVTAGVATINVSFQYRAKNIGGVVSKAGDQNTTVSREAPLNATSARGAVNATQLLVEVQAAAGRTVKWCGSIDVVEQLV